MLGVDFPDALWFSGTMKTCIRFLFVLLVLPLVAQAADSGKESADTNRFTLRLTDGSAIICQPKIANVPIKTSFADIQIPLSKIETLKLDPKNKTATVLLRNGDKIQGECQLTEINIASVMGELKVSTTLITELASAIQKTPVFTDSPAKCQQCINNLRLIDHAKQQLATASQTMTDSYVPNWNELTPYFRGNRQLVCPAGGTYSVNAIISNPTCNVPGHALQEQ